MSEFENDYVGEGYQTEESTEQQQTEIPQQQESYSEAPPSAFRVKYNKEEMEIPYEQAPEFIQKGLNYDKVSSRVSEYEAAMDRIARITGYDNREEMIQYLDEVERQREQERFDELGIDRNAFDTLLNEHPDIQFAREIRAQKEQEQRLAYEGQELFAEFPNLKVDEIPPEVWMLREERGLSLLDSYLRVNYKNMSQQKEQEVINKLQNNQFSSPGALGREGTQHKTNYAQLSQKEKAALRERVLRGERVEF